MAMALLVILPGAGWPRGFADPETGATDLSDESQAAVRRALDYLVHNQSATQGSVGRQFPVATTALTGLALLAHGVQAQRGPAVGLAQGRGTTYARALELCVQYIEQVARTGPYGGYINDASRGEDGRMHAHGYATLFLCEVYGTSRQELQPRLKRAIARAIKVIQDAQTEDGGWGYLPAGHPQYNGFDEASVTITMIQALRAARHAGFAVKVSNIARAIRYVQRSATADGSFRYSLKAEGGGARTSFELTAAAVSTLNASGVYAGPELERGLAYMRQRIRDREDPWMVASEFPFYGNLYAAQAFFQSGDADFDPWFAAVRAHLVREQIRGADGGYWENQRGNEYAAAVGVLILSIPNRYLTIFQR